MGEQNQSFGELACQLEKCGFSRNEAKVYTCLLYTGSASAGTVADKSGVHRTNVYDAIERLQEKGLVATSMKKGINFFEASPPSQILEIQKEKERMINGLMPQLETIQNFAPEKSEAHIYQGLPAIRNMLNHLLIKKQPINVYGITKLAPVLLGPFILQFHKRRAALKVQFNHIYNHDAGERVTFLNTLPYTEARILPKDFDSSVSTTICGDEVLLILWENNAHAIHIINKDLAESYNRYFELMWKIAKRPEEIGMRKKGKK